MILAANSSLRSVMPLGENGNIVVYNQQFESQRFLNLQALATRICNQRIRDIQCRLWDLLPVVRKHVYHSAFAGSYSLKIRAACAGARDDLREACPLRTGRTPGWLGNRSSGETWLSPSATG
jgi:hypothetical protein